MTVIMVATLLRIVKRRIVPTQARAPSQSRGAGSTSLPNSSRERMVSRWDVDPASAYLGFVAYVPVPATASLQDRLLGIFGRQPSSTGDALVSGNHSDPRERINTPVGNAPPGYLLYAPCSAAI